MNVVYIGPAGMSVHRVDEVAALLAREDGVVWVDIVNFDDAAAELLRTVFQFHPLAIRDCANRNPVPKAHRYTEHVFVVLHAPHPGAAGHVHYVELDQFIGPRYLVSVHGPLNPAVDPEAAQIEANSVHRRLASGKLHPTNGPALSHALVSVLTGRLRDYTALLTTDVWKLEQRVTAGHLGNPEEFLDEMFRARHGLLTVRTMAALSHEVYARLLTIKAFTDVQGEAGLADIADQFHRLEVMSDGQKSYLQGTIEFYQARTNTKMTIAAERLAVIAAVTLPVTAVSSVLGMNVIVNDATQVGPLVIAVAVMLTVSAVLLVWAKRKGWW